MISTRSDRRLDEIEVLFDQDDGETVAQAECLQPLDDLIDDRGLDAFRRLVEKHEFRPAAEAARNRQQLLLAAAQRAAGPVEQRFQARKLGEYGLDRRFLTGPAARTPCAGSRWTLRPGKISRPCGT